MARAGRDKQRQWLLPLLHGQVQLNLQEGWWRIFRKTALAGRSFGDRDHITHATRVATDQLNARARPWIWGKPTPPTRTLPHPGRPLPAREVAARVRLPRQPQC